VKVPTKNFLLCADASIAGAMGGAERNSSALLPNLCVAFIVFEIVLKPDYLSVLWQTKNSLPHAMVNINWVAGPALLS
jgi:hypothetical protein